ncbi:hypothetical protein [Bacillus cereus]|uniref:hypothetical protein n=1 Tax=Bacillus cereus TaxID=1396 RepID=UPI0021124AB7|nr:hypothetical protein [Bacillus cereus]
MLKEDLYMDILTKVQRRKTNIFHKIMPPKGKTSCKNSKMYFTVATHTPTKDWRLSLIQFLI